MLQGYTEEIIMGENLGSTVSVSNMLRKFLELMQRKSDNC